MSCANSTQHETTAGAQNATWKKNKGTYSMPDLQALLDQIDRLEEHITPGPWEAVGRPYNACVSPAGQIRNLARLGDPLDPEAWKNAEFIALARTFCPSASRALRDVLETLDQYIVKFDQDNMEDHIVHGIVHELRNKIYDQFRGQK